MGSISPLEKLLSRLKNVRECGESSYRADCPNEHSSKQQLSVAMKDNRLLLYCHAHCTTLEILQPINLTLADLFERPTETYKTPRQSWEQRELMKMRRWKAITPDLIIEISVLLTAAGQVYRGYALSEEDRERLKRAGRILRSTLEYL